jgi:hypothetical protein
MLLLAVILDLRAEALTMAMPWLMKSTTLMIVAHRHPVTAISAHLAYRVTGKDWRTRFDDVVLNRG